MMKKIIITLLLLMSKTLFALPSNTPLYQVNLIVFTTINQKALQSEHWPNVLIQPNLENALDLIYPDKTKSFNPNSNSVYTYLPYRLRTLHRDAIFLKRNKNYRVIKNIAWIQPMTTLKHAKWVHVFGGRIYDQQGKILTNSTTDNLIEPAYWEINGKIKIGLDRYFTIRSKMFLTLPQMLDQDKTKTNTIYQQIPLQSFSLIQEQRTKSKELNYFDHPLFGLLISITPAIIYE